jgi:DNA-directed RNA polymerase subunit RPC12/RpoP
MSERQGTPAVTADREFPCSQCGATLRYAPGTDALVCDYCGTRNEVSRSAGRRTEGEDAGESGEHDAPAEAAAIVEEDFEGTLAALEGQSESVEPVLVHCNGCGADSRMPANVSATRCPFCGSPQVATGVTRKLIKPKALVPFEVTDQQARDRFKGWLSGLWFAPGDLKAAAAMDGRLTGTYLPFWTYDAQAETDYRGKRGDYYYVTRMVTTRVNGRTVTRPQQERRIRWTSVSGRVHDRFDDVVVAGSGSVPPEKISGTGGFDLVALRPFAEAYLAGFVAEGYTVSLAQGWEAARGEMTEGVKGTIRADIGGDQQVIDSMAPHWYAITFKHVLLPVWIAAYRYRGKVYRFIVNGQTGRVSGDRPYSFWKITFAVLAGLAVVGVIVLVVMASGNAR